jgi:outer membrane lipoprotein-sorting protein
MIRFLDVALAAAAVALLPSPPAQAQDAAGDDGGLAALRSAAARYDRAGGLCADFVQELDNPLLGESRTSRGRLCQLRPNLFRMDFTDPAGDQVVSDGEHFYLHYPSMNPGQVIRAPLDPSRGGLDFFREFLADPGSKYRVRAEGREEVAGHKVLHLHLTPRRSGGIREARVWVDPVEDVIRKVAVTESNGVRRTVTLLEPTLSPDVAPVDFEFELPPGANVVDVAGRGGRIR